MPLGLVLGVAGRLAPDRIGFESLQLHKQEDKMKRKGLLGRVKKAAWTPLSRPTRSKILLGVLIAGSIGAYSVAAVASWVHRLNPRNW